MSREELDSEKAELLRPFEYFKAALLVILGIGIVICSMVLGKEWNWGELVYDLGLAVVIAAIVELFILQALTSWKPEWLKVVEGIEKSIRELKVLGEESHRKALEMEVKDIARKAERIESRITKLSGEIEHIKRAVDPTYSELIKAIESEQEDSGR